MKDKEPTKRPSKKQLLFIRFLLEQGARWNIPEAARKAGYANPAKSGQDLVKKDYISAILDKEIDRALGGARKIFKMYVTRELIDMARANIGDYLDDDGDIDIEKIREINPGAVKEYRKGKNGVSVKLQDKKGAMELLLRILDFDVSEKQKLDVFMNVEFKDM